MTDHPTATLDGVSHPLFARGRSTALLSLRDVRDIEAYVIETIFEAGFELSDGDLDELVASGIESVYRLERALPPQQPLLPVLDNLLPPRLAELCRALDLDLAAPVQSATAIAA
jgi:hypothetical protein